MPQAVELLRQGRGEELWQMCCGYLTLNLEQFMTIQKRLLVEQLELLHRSKLGKKVMRGARPDSVEEFREEVPLTDYADYCPELAEKRENGLPAKPALWVHTSGRSGEYTCKWVPFTSTFCREMSTIMYGIGMLSCSREWGDTDGFPTCPRLIYTVAPRPYVTGAMASLLEQQTPIAYLPALEEAEALSFEERVRLGFKQALSQGLDYFFGLSLVLVAVGDKFSQPAGSKIDIRPLLSQPRALFRLAKGLTKSKLARRPLLPRDLWSVKGIMSGGLDSGVYKDRIKELWGRYPLDTYTGTEGGIVATQTWDYDGMTFVPHLNFLEFIPEEEHLKWQLDHSYQPRVLLLDEVKAGENYEIVITNFHGGAMVRYRPGDMIRIVSLRNENLDIDIPQMVFERRADDLLDFVVIRLTEKNIWQAIEHAGIPYVDWTAYKKPGEAVLNLLIELKDDYRASAEDVATAVYDQIMHSDNDAYTTSERHDDLVSMINFGVEVTLLPRGTFANYTAQRQAEGADLAHLKPPHINPSAKVLSLLRAKPEVAPKVEAGARAVR
ncbi:MAG: GH3 auxin-responsive promoter family protein [Dehalococcoidia bacterium]|nr:MAG: GH3 auxin-responsive promoter family protein [Dehalococcoidia bacterium]